ncbi:MAG: phosphoglycerate dehydrogenase [Spirochaetales bacterium]|nr:phosphoglycerate dehydrogenase [Spirochaetales bacterium]
MNVLVTSRSFGAHEPDALRRLEDRGWSVARMDDGPFDSSRIASEIRGVDVLIVGNDRVDETVFAAADRLKLVHMHGTGLDGIDIAAATRREVLVANVSGANKNAVAELTLALMLVTGRRIHEHIDAARSGTWSRRAGHEIGGSAVGIVGLGNIGRRVVELLSGFRPSILGVDPDLDGEWARTAGVEVVRDVEELFRRADWIVLTVPLTSATKNLIDRRALSLMKRNAVLINTSRGGIVDEEALAEALERGTIAGAALDAFSVEPLPLDSPLRRTSAVITPHIAATSVETSALVSRRVTDNVLAIVEDGRVERAVNAEEIAFKTHQRSER